MRVAPAVHVSVTRFGVWRAIVGSTLVLTWGVLIAWGTAHWRSQEGAPSSVVAALAVASLAGLVSAALAARLLKVREFSLRWDGRCWHLASSGAPGADAAPGEVHAAIDVGVWLLLRFEPERRARREAPRWLPVQRRGLESSWHGLRCAVFSPRLAGGQAGAGAE